MALFEWKTLVIQKLAVVRPGAVGFFYGSNVLSDENLTHTPFIHLLLIAFTFKDSANVFKRRIQVLFWESDLR